MIDTRFVVRAIEKGQAFVELQLFEIAISGILKFAEIMSHD